ncbi:MAG: hypothetical protein JST79_16145 [Acidobacteria bacterium]|nr:hypothetical protein [Acidobacteriota bacterium]
MTSASIEFPMEALTYPYKPKAWNMVLVIVFFGACFLVGWHVSGSNHEQVVLGWRLSPEQARVVFSAAAGASFLFVIGGALGLRAALSDWGRLTLNAQELSLPKYPFLRVLTTVPLRDIQRLELQEVKRKRFLHIYHANGRITVTEALLPSRKAFDKVRAALEQR